MKLYHGSIVDIQKIDLDKSKPNKDFGKAFYLSEDYQQAMDIVYDHRTEPQGRTLHDYDIVYGPIANDRIGAQITRFRQGYITFAESLRCCL